MKGAFIRITLILSIVGFPGRAAPPATKGATPSSPKVVMGPPEPGKSCIEPVVVKWEVFTFYTYQCPITPPPQATAPTLKPASGGIVAPQSTSDPLAPLRELGNLDKYTPTVPGRTESPRVDAFAEMNAWNSQVGGRAAEARASGEAGAAAYYFVPRNYAAKVDELTKAQNTLSEFAMGKADEAHLKVLRGLNGKEVDNKFDGLKMPRAASTRSKHWEIPPNKHLVDSLERSQRLTSLREKLALAAETPLSVIATGHGYLALRAAEEAGENGDPDGDFEFFVSVGIALADVGLGFIPGVGFGRDAFEAISGLHALTGEKLSPLERGLAISGVVTVGIVSGVVAIKGLRKLARVEKGAVEAFERSVDIGQTLAQKTKVVETYHGGTLQHPYLAKKFDVPQSLGMPNGAGSFRSGVYRERVTTDALKAYRVYDAGKGEWNLGTFVTMARPTGRTQSKLDFALGTFRFDGKIIPHDVTHAVEFRIPKGETILEGVASEWRSLHFGEYLPGGGSQLVIPKNKIPKEWFIKEWELPK